MSGKALYDRDKLVPQICDRLATGEPLTSICRDLGMDRSTVRKWWNEDEAILKQIQQAREDGYHALAEECLEIADHTQEGVEIVERAGKKELHRGDMLGHRKLRIETRLKLLAKWYPSHYGDKVEHEHKGGITVHLDATDSAL